MDEPKMSDAQAEATAAARRLMHAYVHVFGEVGMRSPQQVAVWEDMKRRARVEHPVFVATLDGRLDPLNAAWADGARCMFLQIAEILEKSRMGPKEKPPVIK